MHCNRLPPVPRACRAPRIIPQESCLRGCWQGRLFSWGQSRKLNCETNGGSDEHIEKGGWRFCLDGWGNLLPSRRIADGEQAGKDGGFVAARLYACTMRTQIDSTAVNKAQNSVHNDAAMAAALPAHLLSSSAFRFHTPAAQRCSHRGRPVVSFSTQPVVFVVCVFSLFVLFFCCCHLSSSAANTPHDGV
jgi:hypothetical protein